MSTPKKYFRTSVTNTVPNTRIICITVIQQKKFEINHLRLFDPMLKISFITLVIFCNFLDEDKWKTEARTEGGAIQEYTISYQNLVPSTIYNFRVIAYNKYGISSPLEEKSSVSPRICIPYIYDTAVIFFFKKVVRWLCKYPNTILDLYCLFLADPQGPIFTFALKGS